MTPEPFGYFSHRQADVPEGLRYVYRLADGGEYPDPASRWQPLGVHKPSAVFFTEDFVWSDADWRGVTREDLVIYELHVGTFTPEGTFDAIIPRLTELVELGVTAVELMPVAQFPGERNWGYDGVYPYAVQNSYGGPRALQRLVNAAHCAGLAMFLDVVYNHYGPEGNYLGNFGSYFTDRYHTPWGNAKNFDGSDSEPVRRFVLDNARMWIRDFHFDGLRLDAIQTIYDLGTSPIIAELQIEAQAEAARQNRAIHVIAETNQNDVRHVLPLERGGYGLSGIWNDDFHHSVHALLTGEQNGYYLDFGWPEHLVKSYNDVFTYDGSYSRFLRRRRGSRTGDIDRTRFVNAIQNHDQVGNQVHGERFGTLLSPEAQRLACALLMLSPCVPMLFMGEEYGEDRPFPFFCTIDDPTLVKAVREGRRKEVAEMTNDANVVIPDPQNPATFASGILAWSWPEGSHYARLRQLYRDLLAARREWPALVDRRNCRACLSHGAKTSEETPDNRTDILILERGTKEASLTAVANLTPNELYFSELPMANRRLKLSTEDIRYGGARAVDRKLEQLSPYELIIFE
jgi:maltooligosyltrehalose trehalohydrolase